MPLFVYKAKKDTHHTVTGQLMADHVDEAVEMIHRLGLVPVSVLPATDAGILMKDIKPVHVASQHVAVFCRQLSGLLKSGVPLLKALEVIAGQTKQHYFASILHGMAMGVKSGRSFSSCLSDYPQVFDPLMIALIRAGEEVGQLKYMLLNMSEFLRKQEEFITKVRQALVYPALMLLVGLGTVIFILTFVMPKVTVIFVNANQRLPWPTLVVMNLSHMLKYIGLPLLVFMAVGTLAFNRWRKTPLGRVQVMGILTRFPFIKDFILKVDLARFTRTLQMLLDSGLPIVRAIETVIPTIYNAGLRSQLLVCAQHINGGESIGGALSGASFLDPMMVSQIAIAQESGNLPVALGELAQNYEQEVDAITKTATVLLEPIMIVGVGAIVGFMVFAMLMPIFSMDIMAH